MIEPESMDALQRELRERMRVDRGLLDELRAELRRGLGETRRIMPRLTTAISLVGTDGGNNQVEFDPFMAQLVRVVDSSKNEHHLEVITPTSDLEELSAKHLGPSGPKSALGKMMEFLGVKKLWDLSWMIARPPKRNSPSWVQTYRQLMEWAVLFKLLREKDYGTDTIVVWDGLLRTKVFAGRGTPESPALFGRFMEGINEAIREHKRRSRRNLYVVGIAKKNKVLQRYRLAMALEGVMRHHYPCYAEVGRELERSSYVWDEWARGSDVASEQGGEAVKFVAGKMFFVKFGDRPNDPVWPVDVLESQVEHAQLLFGSLLVDALNGFPVPFYPSCLQRAHDNAALTGFDMDILQRGIVSSIRDTLGEQAPLLDEIQLIDADPAGRRYE